MADESAHARARRGPSDQGGAAAGRRGSSRGAFVATDVAHRVLRQRYPRAVRAARDRRQRCGHRARALPRPPSLQDLAGLLEKTKAVYDAIQALGNAPAPTGADAAAYAEEIGERLFELLLTDYLAAEQPGAYNVLVDAARDLDREHRRPRRRGRRTCARISAGKSCRRSIERSEGLPERVYGWGRLDFDDRLLLEHLAARSASRSACRSRTAISDEDALTGYLGSDARVSATVRPLARFCRSSTPTSAARRSKARSRSSDFQARRRSPGLILEPRLPSAMPLEFQLAPSVQIKVRNGTNLGELFGITLTPPDRVDVRYPLAPGHTAAGCRDRHQLSRMRLRRRSRSSATPRFAD